MAGVDQREPPDVEKLGAPLRSDPSHPTVYYRGTLVGTLIPDLIVDDFVIVDPKVVESFNDTHIAQMLGYLNITNLDLALLLNFKYAKLKWKRVANSVKRNND